MQSKSFQWRTVLLMTSMLVILLNYRHAFSESRMVRVPSGIYTPFFFDEKKTEVQMKYFWIDERAVTNHDFKMFLKKHSQYSKSKLGPLFRNQDYLREINGRPEYPITYVSWFAARAFCESLGRRLPTLAEWEYASDSANPENLGLILNWYSRPGTQISLDPTVTKKNKFGVSGMHGLIWEWVEDFNSVMVSTDSRGKGGGKRSDLFCGGGSVNAGDAKQYATFMRFAFRSSLVGRDTLGTLGFRCAKN